MLGPCARLGDLVLWLDEPQQLALQVLQRLESAGHKPLALHDREELLDLGMRRFQVARRGGARESIKSPLCSKVLSGDMDLVMALNEVSPVGLLPLHPRRRRQGRSGERELQAVDYWSSPQSSPRKVECGPEPGCQP